MDPASANPVRADADGVVTVANPPGQDTIAYRAGDFTTFRRALLQPLPGEQELAAFAPTPGDLGLQALEWWAYLADILTFYNERIATESYLRTATRAESVDRLVRTLGHRRGPGIAATGRLAALRRPGRTGEPLVIPAGSAINSTPSPGVAAQTFEALTDTAFTGPAVVPVAPVAPSPQMSTGSVLLAGHIASVKQADRLLLVPKSWDGTTANWALITVDTVTTEPDPTGRPNTRITYLNKQVDAGTDPGVAGSDPRSLRLLRLGAPTPLWAHGAAQAPDIIPDFVTRFAAIRPMTAVRPIDALRYVAHQWIQVLTLGGGALSIRLAAVTRGLSAGDLVVLDAASKAESLPGVVASSSEELWFVKTTDGSSWSFFPPPPDDATTAKPGPPVLPIMHTIVNLKVPTASNYSLPDPASSVLRTRLQDVGTVIADPIENTQSLQWPLIVEPSWTAQFAANGADLVDGTTAIVEDTNGTGVLVTVAKGADNSLVLNQQGSGQPPALTVPLRLLCDLVDVSRGKSVQSETLGSGDARIGGQTFTLAKSPLTYLAAGDGYTSTLRVLVNGIAWTEAGSFYGQLPDARIYVTRELPDGTTQVRFGDGENGARLPSGSGNVVAWYRYGSGAAKPPAGRVTSLAHPQPNLAGFRNPIQVEGGADPEPPESLRSAAPASTFTFGRAISATDYETIAARTAGVRRATALWQWDAAEQRTLVAVYVGDGDAAADLARKALAGAQDPANPVSVHAATAVDLTVSCTLVISPDRQPDEVAAAASSALLDPDTGLLSPAQMSIGQPLYRSRLDAVLTVDGVTAIRGLKVRAPAWQLSYPAPPRFWWWWLVDDGRASLVERFVPLTGRYFQLTADNTHITTITGPGPGDSHD